MSNESNNGYIDYDAVLADLQAKRDQIDAAIAGISLMRGGATPSASASPSAAATRGIPPNAFFTMGIGEAACKYLEMVKGKQTVQQITRALEQGGMPPLKVNTVYAALRRREAVNRDLIRLGEEWGLKEWYSNVSLPRTVKPKPHPKAKPKAKAKAPVRPATPKATPDPAKAAEPPTSAATNPTASMSMLEATIEILKTAGKPLHASVLAEELKAYGRNSTINSVRGSLPQDSKKRFVNVGGNTWGLAEWTEQGEKINPNEV